MFTAAEIISARKVSRVQTILRAGETEDCSENDESPVLGNSPGRFSVLPIESTFPCAEEAQMRRAFNGNGKRSICAVSPAQPGINFLRGERFRSARKCAQGAAG